MREKAKKRKGKTDGQDDRNKKKKTKGGKEPF